MKYKKKLAALKAAQDWWDKQPQSFKHATTRPGGINQTTLSYEKSLENVSYQLNFISDTLSD